VLHDALARERNPLSIEDQTEPDWEILNLLREVRRRAKSASARSYLARLSEEPRWVAALPPAEARFARTMLEATREMALSSTGQAQPQDALASPELSTVERPAPRRRRAR
jgi:hypothetical protein